MHASTAQSAVLAKRMPQNRSKKRACLHLELVAIFSCESKKSSLKYSSPKHSEKKSFFVGIISATFHPKRHVLEETQNREN
jgi:hypothetical protein